MRIALLAHHVAPLRAPFAGGVESFTWYLARWLADRGHRVVLYAPPGSHVPGVELRTLALDAAFSPAARHDVSMPPDLFMAAHDAYLQAMLELADEGEHHDVVHSNTLHYLPLAMARTLAAPLLTTLHTPPTPWLESALRRATRTGRPVLSAVSSATRDAWAGIVPRMPVVRNGVDTDRWRPGPGGEGAAWSGRIVPEKAPHLAIDACRRAGVPLRLAGPVIDEAYWRSEVRPRLGPGAEHVGHLDHDELGRLLGAADVALLTPAWDEPFGLAAAEAMACGTPVAGFARGGLPELVGRDGGELVRGHDVEALAGALVRAADRDRAVVRAHAVRTAGIDAMGERYERLYASLATSAPTHAARPGPRRRRRRPTAVPLPAAS